MVDAIDRFRPYLQAILTSSKESSCRDWQEFYLPTQAELPSRVQTCLPSQASSQSREEKREQMEVLDGLRKYASGHVLVVGKPGSGKSTSLKRLRWEEARRCWEAQEQGNGEALQIPVFLELRDFRYDSVLQLIQRSLRQGKLRLSEAEIEDLLFDRRLLLLFDGLNELPSDEAWRKVDDFRQDYADTPMIFSTRELGAGADLGIEKKLEMMPLTEPQMRQFIEKRLLGQAEDLLRQIHDRLRELAETPLLLKLLCDVFAQKGQIPKNRGELFRKEFAQRYEEFKPLRGRISEDSRRFAPELLQYLAFVMTQGDLHSDPCKPTASWLTIPKTQAEGILETFLTGRVSAPAQAAKEWLEDLVEYHLLQVANDPNRIKFHHQLFQDYYAAEWLLLQLPALSDEQLQYYFLNYLKWTEAIGLMLGLIDENDFGGCGKEQAIRVVKLALGIDSPPAVDLMLGARLAGEVQHEFQAKTTRLISNLKTQQFPKVTYLGNTRSEYAVCDIKEFLANENLEIRKNAVKALGQISTQYSVEVLDITFNDKESVVREATAVALGKIGNERATQLLTQKIKDESDDKVRGNIADALGEIGSELAGFVLKKWKNQEDESAYTTIRIEVALCKIFGDIEKPELFKKIIPNEPLFEPDSLKNITEEDALDSLTEELKHETWTVRRKAVIRLSERKEEQKAFLALLQTVNDVEKIVRRESVYALRDTINPTAIPALLKALKDECPLVRRSAAFTLGNIRNQEAVYGLSQALQDSDRSVVVNSINALEKIGGEKAALVLIREFNKGDPRTCEKCLRAIGEIGHTIATPDLLRVLSDSKHPASSLVGMNFFQVLGKVADEKLLPDFLCWQAQAIESRNIEIFAKAIAAIQNCCQFYNYEIAQSDPPPAVKQASGVGNQEQTINIGSVGILNTGHVTIHGDQIGDTSNG